MKKYLLLSIFLLFISCFASKPKYLTSKFNPDTRTGLESKININGYYVLDPNCEYNFYRIFAFYNNGLVINYNTSIFDKTAFDDVSSFNWGIYNIISDTIRSQIIINSGVLYGYGVTKADLLILPKGELLYFGNYYSDDIENKDVELVPTQCPTQFQFYPTDSLPDYRQCPYLKKKWFVER